MKTASWREDKRSASDRGYTYRWRKAREHFLHAHPICEYCEAHDRITAATVVDHRIAHRGDPVLFWDRENWAASCKRCHDSDRQRFEKSGTVIGCDENGHPLDTRSHWFKA